MTDLDRAIRAKLDQFTEDYFLVGEYGSNPGPGHNEMRDAILAVLDLHGPSDLDDPRWCGSCIGNDGYGIVSIPCPTVRAIAKALGLEAPDV
jgi:hypothetical protein